MTQFQRFALLAAVLFIGACVVRPVRAAETPSAPYFSVRDGETIERLPLLQTAATVDIAGPIAAVTLKQTFENRGTATIEATYVFPASDRAAVSGLTMRVGDRVVEARLHEREEAKRTYEAAKESGRTAAMLEQHDPGTFRMTLANILAGDRIDVELHYTELLIPTAGVYEFELPNTFGVERYARPGDASIETPRSAAPEVTDYSLSVDVKLMAGMPIASIESPTHRIVIDSPRSSETIVRLADDEVKASTRDFRLRYSLAGGEISSGLVLASAANENFFLLLMQPPRFPAPASIAPREYIFVLDVSGSMNGAPMDAAKSMMHVLLSTLRPRDRFNVVMFAGAADVLSQQGSLVAGDDTVARAMQSIDNVKPAGGTDLIAALETAYALPHAAGMSRSLVIVTDGGIEADGHAARLIRSHLDEANVFSFGVGARVDRAVMHRLARAGLGEPFFAADAEQGAAEIARFRHYIEQPVLTHVEVRFDGFDAYDVIPEKLPDLFAERPIVLIGKYRGEATGEIHVSGVTGAGPFTGTVHVAGAERSDAVSPLRALWARERIADRLDAGLSPLVASDDKEEIVKLSLDYDVLTPYTAFVAVTPERRNDGPAPVKVDQPTPLRASMGGGDGDALASGVRLVTALASANIVVPASREMRELAGKRFLDKDGIWTDTTHDRSCIVLRIRRGSAAYANLLALRPDLAEWFALGSRVLVRLGRYSVLVGADGFSDYPEPTLRRAARG